MREALSGWLSAVRLECRILRDEAYFLEMDDQFCQGSRHCPLAEEGLGGL
jgi:hypothetical protein